MANYVSSAQNAQSGAVSVLLKSVYMQMAAALTVTGIVAYFLSASPAFWQMLAENGAIVWISIIAQLGLVVWLSARLHALSMGAATLLFILYSVLMGVTMSSIFMVYTMSSIASTFFITAGTFLVMSILGYTTRLDLSRLGSMLLMALIGIIIASVVNIFMHSETLYWIISYAGVLIFVGLTAYDTQEIKMMLAQHGTADDMGHKYALLGALTLYLDFVNLFLHLLRILGNRE
jgi:FtsH-binding integral membrane protein